MNARNEIRPMGQAVLAAVLAAGCAEVAESPPAGSADSEAGAPAGAPNTLTEAERAAGWRLLFDGETAEGWRGYNREEFPDTGWGVIDGMLVVGATATDPDVPVGGDIVTTESFTDFDLRFEFRLSEVANSGVLYRVIEEEGRRDLVGARPSTQVLDDDDAYIEMGHDGHEQTSHRRQLRSARRGREDPARTRRMEPGAASAC